MPIDYRHYPPNWKTEIRPAVLKRAGNKCEWCGVPNGAEGFRDDRGAFWTLDEFGEGLGVFETRDELKTVRIVLTVAHIDQDIANNDLGNLAALCQKCHLTHDAKQHARSVRRNREKKSGQILMEARDD